MVVIVMKKSVWDAVAWRFQKSESAFTLNEIKCSLNAFGKRAAKGTNRNPVAAQANIERKKSFAQLRIARSHLSVRFPVNSNNTRLTSEGDTSIN